MTRRAQTCSIIFLLSLLIRLTLLFGFHRFEIGRAEAARIAISLSQHHTFADPYAVPTGPTAHSGPVYPALIAPFYAILGDAPAADYARFTTNALAASASYALLPLLAEALGLGWEFGVLAGFLGSVFALHHWAECQGEFENTFTALFLEVVVLHFLRLLRTRRLTAGSAARTGLLSGAGLLLSPGVAPVIAALAAVTFWKLRPALATAIRWTALLAAVILLVLAPWVVRNWTQGLGLCFVRDNFGLELSDSNHDGATAVADRNTELPYYRIEHPHLSTAAALELKQVGEAAFEHQKLHQAIHWIRAHPRQFAGLCLARVVRFWFPDVPRFAWAFWLVTLLALAGWVAMFVRARLAAILLAAVLLGHSAVFTIIQTSLRYQHPVWWCLILLATFAVTTCLGLTQPD